MDYRAFVLSALSIFIIMLFIQRLIMPQLARREILFGVRIPPGLLGSPELGEYKKVYQRNYILVCGIYTLCLCVSLWRRPDNIILLCGLAIFFVLSSWLYYNAHKKVKEFKLAHEECDAKKQVVLVETAFRSDRQNRILPSPLWFLLPLALILINIGLGNAAFDNLPIIIPSHWNADGNVDGGVFKSLGVIYAFPIVQSFITLIIFLLYKAVAWSKQQISSAYPQESRERNRIFRYRWGANLIFLNTVIVAGLSMMNLFILQVLKGVLSVVLLMEPLLFLFILLDILFMSVWTGQGGSRIRMPETKVEPGSISGLDDDEHWLLGLVYFNREDPALFVEKRFGIAWGLNYASIKAYLLIGTLVGSLYALSCLLEYMLL